MKTWNIRIITTGSLLFILAMAVAAGAQQGQQVRAANTAGIAQNLGIQEFLRGLRLTETQREAIKAIVQSHRSEILDTREALLQARLALVKEYAKGPGDFGAAQARLMHLRLLIFNEIKTKLTADQLAVLQERQERQADRLERILERLRERGAN
jgi:Spy/CpxP family protein refolding chaperone